MGERTRTRPRRAAVVGAGLSGLTAAYRLQQEGWEVEVFEASGAVGGRVQTEHRRGYRIDTGAAGLASTYVGYRALAAELGVGIVPTATQIGIRREGRTHLLDMTRMLRSGLRTPLLSPGAKLRTGRLVLDVARARFAGRLDYADLSKAAPIDTESARAYARRALSTEIDDYLCGPIVRTMLIAETDKVSKVELFSGINNVFAASFMATAGGQGRLPEVLAEKLTVHLDTPITEVRRTGAGVQLTTRASTSSWDACVVACPLPEAANIVVDDRHLLEPLRTSLGYTRCLTVAVGTTVRPDCPAFLVMYPSVEDSEIALTFLDHHKAADRAPAGHGLMSFLWEAEASARMFDASDEEIVERTLRTAYRVFPEIRGSVELTHVTRWRQALPYTQIGAYQQIGRFNASLDPASPVQYAADFMSAAGQNTAVEFGGRAARRIIEHAS